MQKPDAESFAEQPPEPADASAAEGGAPAHPELQRLLEAAPAHVRHEYEEARKELAVLGMAIATIAQARDEATVIAVARQVRSRVARIGVRWLRARSAVAASQAGAVTGIVAGGATGEVHRDAVPRIIA